MFQVVSDIHLEMLNETNDIKLDKFIQDRIEPSAPFLLLAGDIGHSHRPNYRKFLDWCSERFVHVFIVAGNHEYYKTNYLIRMGQYDMEAAENRHREVAKEWDNVHFLQKDRVDFQHEGVEYTVLGCTLWAEIPRNFWSTVWTQMNDYTQIFMDRGKLLTPEKSDGLHRDHKRWLFEELDDLNSDGNSNRVLVVLTHHAPSKRMDTGKLKHGYSSDIEHLIGNSIYAWVNGHTHENVRLQTNDGTWLVSNCIGYRQQKTGFSKECIV